MKDHAGRLRFAAIRTISSRCGPVMLALFKVASGRPAPPSTARRQLKETAKSGLVLVIQPGKSDGRNGDDR